MERIRLIDVEGNDTAQAMAYYKQSVADGSWDAEKSHTLLHMQSNPDELIDAMNSVGEESSASDDGDLMVIEAEIDALTAEIVAEWEDRSDESDEIREDMLIGGGHRIGTGKYDPNLHPHGSHGQFKVTTGGKKKTAESGAAARAPSAKSRSTPEAKAARAEKAKGHAERASTALGSIETRRAASEAKHAKAVEATKSALVEAKAARDKAKKDPSAKNLQAWERATQKAVKARASVDKHAESATKHAELHEKAKTTHALAQSKLKEAERQAGGQQGLPKARDLEGVGFDRIGGGHGEAPAAAGAHAPVAGHRSQVTEAEFKAIGDRKAAEAAAVKALEPKPTGTTSVWKPTSVAQEAKLHEERVKQGGGGDSRRAGETWYAHDKRVAAERQASAAKANPAPKATALPHAAALVGFDSIPSKKRKKSETRTDEVEAIARATVAVAKAYGTAEAIARAREAVAHARRLRSEDK